MTDLSITTTLAATDRLAFRGYPLGGCPVSPQRFKGATAERHFRRGYHNRTEEECKS